jgi:predicted negative regulator of RcsB-dependent stress response
LHACAWYAAERLADLLAKQGRVDEAIAILRVRADANDRYAWYAAERLADLLAKQGRVDEAIAILRVRADANDGSAAERLADLLAKQGRVDELRAGADETPPRIKQQE